MNSVLLFFSGFFVSYINYVTDTTPKVIGSSVELSVSMGDDLKSIAKQYPMKVLYSNYPFLKIFGFQYTYNEQIPIEVIESYEYSGADWPGWPGRFEPTSISLNLKLDSKSMAIKNLGHLQLNAKHNLINEVSFYTHHFDGEVALKNELNAMIDTLNKSGFAYKGDFNSEWQKNIVDEFPKPDQKNTLSPFSSAIRNEKYEIQVLLNVRRDLRYIKVDPNAIDNSLAGFYEIQIREYKHQPEIKEITATLVDYGIYETHYKRKIEDEKVAGGLVESEDKTLIKQTDQIESKLGTSFGFRYTLDGPSTRFTSPPPGRTRRYALRGKGIANVTIKVNHPVPIKDPISGKEFLTSEWSQDVLVSPDSVNWNTGWVFENEWEIVRGKWIIQLSLEDKILLEKEFFITKSSELGKD